MYVEVENRFKGLRLRKCRVFLFMYIFLLKFWGFILFKRICNVNFFKIFLMFGFIYIYGIF